MITPRIEPVAFAMLGKCIYHCASWPHQDWKYKWGLTCFWCSSRMHKLKAFTVANELPALIRNELSSLKSMYGMYSTHINQVVFAIITV